MRTSTFLWFWGAAVAFGALAAHTIISVFTYQPFLPQWGVMAAVSYFVFSFVFRAINLRYLDPARFDSQKDVDYKPAARWCFMAFMLAVIVCHFWAGLPYIPTVIGAFVGCIVVPMPIYGFWGRRRIHKADTQALSPREIAGAASGHPDVFRFLSFAGELSLFITDLKWRNREARCLYLHRVPYPEKGVTLDMCLEVMVEIRTCKMVSKPSVMQAYFHLPDNEGTCVLTLDIGPRLPESLTCPVPSENDLVRLHGSPARFPDLSELPLPVAARKVEFDLMQVTPFAITPVPVPN